MKRFAKKYQEKPREKFPACAFWAFLEGKQNLNSTNGINGCWEIPLKELSRILVAHISSINVVSSKKGDMALKMNSCESDDGKWQWHICVGRYMRFHHLLRLSWMCVKLLCNARIYIEWKFSVTWLSSHPRIIDFNEFVTSIGIVIFFEGQIIWKFLKLRFC